jgi:hypothetical protein
MDGSGATLSRRAGRFLVGIAIWNLLTYALFTKNLYWHGSDEPDRPTGYYVAHTVLIIVNLGIAVALAPLGWRVLQAHRARSAAGSAPPATGVGADRG